MTQPLALTVFATAGLCNRLRALLSAMAIAEASDRAFTMVWPRTPACAASFRELFANDWPVTDVDELDPSWHVHHIAGYTRRCTPDLLPDSRPEIVLGYHGWLLDPRRYPAHKPLRACCAELIAQLEPLPAISERVDTFRARHFRSTMLGIHLRRGDYVRDRPDMAANTGEALAAADRLLNEAPAAGILLCTDDGAVDQRTGETHCEGVREIFRARYGTRLVETTPRSLDRRTPEAIQDALADLLLLRATHAFVGTASSSFSELAVFGRAVPHVYVGGGTPVYRRRERVARLTGMSWLVRSIIRVIYGPDHDIPWPVVQRRITRAAARARATVRSRMPAIRKMS